jgi:phosphatidate cytidylyltransferase
MIIARGGENLGDYDRGSLILRIITSVIITVFIFGVIFWGSITLYSAVTIILTSLALWEFYKMLEIKYRRVYKVLGLLLSLLVFISCFYTLESWFIYFLAFGLVVLFLIQFTIKTNENACLSIALTFLGLIYITVPFLFVIKIRLLTGGVFFITYFILVTKATDIGAYLVGMKFGKNKLIPRISPNKSIEGFLGGIVFALIFAYLGVLYYPNYLNLRYVPAIGFILGLFAQVGDLAESVLKRDCGFKDSGKVLPGLGGILDLVDSMLLSLPFYYLYISKVVLR